MTGFLGRLLRHREGVDAAERLPPVRLTYWTGEARWRLDETYVYREPGFTLTVPRGFAFDLASVPRALWLIVAPFELSIAGPLLHDFLYRHGGRPPEGTVEPQGRRWRRVDADRLFCELMAIQGVPLWRVIVGYAAVRLGGVFAWRGRGRNGA